MADLNRLSQSNLMKNFHIKSDPRVANSFNNYPSHVKERMLDLRDLIIQTAKEIDNITVLEETLKWNEPSYLTKYGSTLRMDWKPKSPNQYAMYFQCSSRLVATFRSLFSNHLQFEGNRAIVFQLDDEIPIEVLKHCIKAALTYHQVKHLPTLGL